MARRAFYSFHYKPDNWRASQVRNMGVIEGNRPCSDNDWETIKKGGDKEIAKWIAKQLDGKSCAVVLIGTNTAGRKWINHEINKAWKEKKGVVGVYVHKLLDSNEKQAKKGANPFTGVKDPDTGKKLSEIVKAHDPPYQTSKYVYDHIKKNLSKWVEEAIKIRENA